jgi:predicted lipoprotein with Yx(FWY)xxD motif
VTARRPEASLTKTFARVALSAVLATGLGLAMIAPASASSSSDATTSVADGKKKQKKPTIKTAKTDLGKILVTTKNRVLYIYDPDGTETAAAKCVDACADAWPAYAPNRKPKVGKGLDASLAGVGGGGQATTTAGCSTSSAATPRPARRAARMSVACGTWSAPTANRSRADVQASSR